MAISARMLAHPCQRYQWFVFRQGFGESDTIHTWKYDLNRVIESWGVKFFEYNLWAVTPLDYVKLEPVRTSTLYKVQGFSEALNLPGVENRPYILYCRSVQNSGFKRIKQVKIHKVHKNVTLEALLNYHVLSMHDILYEPLVIFLNRDSLSYHVEPLFSRIKGYDKIAKSFYTQTLEAVESDLSSLPTPDSPDHCTYCPFRKECQTALLK